MVRLAEKQKQFYNDNGYIIIKNVFSEEELNKVTEEYDKLFARKNEEKILSTWVGNDKEGRKPDGSKVVYGIHNLQYHHSVFGKLLYNDSLLDALEDVLGTENIALHHTKAHFKPPEKGASYPMHQDYHYFPFKNDSPVAAFIHLDDADRENGGLCVYPGSHKLGPQEDFGPKEGSSFHYVDKIKFSIENSTPIIAERGDVVIFSYLLIHGSSTNNSERPRRMLLVEVSDAEDLSVGRNPGIGWMLRGVNINKDASLASHLYDHMQ